MKEELSAVRATFDMVRPSLKPAQSGPMASQLALLEQRIAEAETEAMELRDACVKAQRAFATLDEGHDPRGYLDRAVGAVQSALRRSDP